MKIKRVSLSEVREKALPILLSGYEKRKALRSSVEELLRSPEMVAVTNNLQANLASALSELYNCYHSDSEILHESVAIIKYKKPL